MVLGWMKGLPLLLPNVPFCLRVPDGWRHVGRVAGDEEVILTFALRQQHVSKLEELVEQVSDPRSPLYGQHLSLAELSKLVQPSSETLIKVRTWLEKHGVLECDTVQTGDFIQCRTQASLAERLLPGAQFNRYVNGDQSIVRSSSSYSISPEVAAQIDFGKISSQASSASGME
uniref:Peptidase S53 activation domain-containing protein n=1 Tax=Leptobrachium leishanense TaxID=445787 RepID=A0A8C5WE04_9ANUR